MYTVKMNRAILERIETALLLRLLPKKEDCASTEMAVNKRSQDGRTLLHFASDYGLEKLCLTLVSVGAEVNTGDNFGTTPLMSACRRGYSRIVQHLLQAGADPTVLNHYGIDSLPMTLTNQNQEIFIKIRGITQNIMYNSIIGEISMTQLASALGTTYYVKLLCIEHSNTINIPAEKSGMTCLMLAVNGNFSSTVETLLEFGAMITAINSYSMTASQIATISMNDLNIEKRLSPAIHIDSPCTHKKKSDFLLRTPQQRFLSIPLVENVPKLRHPLTPNICVSTKLRRDKNRNVKVKGFLQFKNFKRRSRSVENRSTLIKTNNDPDGRDILEFILISTELYEYWPIFKSNEINFKTFITMNDDDLKCIGIKKNSARSKIIKVIKHNKRLFC